MFYKFKKLIQRYYIKVNIRKLENKNQWEANIQKSTVITIMRK
jgi:hypothetical protein